MEVKRTHCLFCHCRCPVLVHVEDNKVVKVEGDKESSSSKGFICIKGANAPEYHDHPERVNYALKRTGERGENKWQRIPWEQALDEIAERLQKIKGENGPESLVTSEGTHRTGTEWVRRAFMNQFGSPNMIHAGTICYCNTQMLHVITYGWGYTMYSISPGETNCTVVWGSNPANSAPSIMKKLRELKSRGGKIIVIDPRSTETAGIADLWLPLRPGTDGALALGWLNLIVNEELYDEEFVNRWTIGFDELKERVEEYTPERVARITGVSEEIISDSARMYAQNKPATILWGVAVDQIGRNASQAIRSQAILKAITGNIDIPGGEELGRTGDILKFLWDADMDCNDVLSEEQRKKQLGSDDFKLMAFPGWELASAPHERLYGRKLPHYYFCSASPVHTWDAMISGKPYPVKAFFAVANNTLLSYANTRKVYQALKNTALLVTVDYWLTPTALLSDYVLPAADWMERAAGQSGGGDSVGNRIGGSERAVKPLYDRHEDYQFWRGLALRLGLKDEGFPWELENLEQIWDYRLKPIGLTLEDVAKRGSIFGPTEYKKYEKQGFATPSGKVEIYSTILEKLGYEPLPYYEETLESPESTPELWKDYPLILSTSPRYLEAYHSEHRHITSLRRKHPDPQAEINEKTAKKYGIQGGDWVYIETPRGRIRMRAKLTSNIPETMVMTEHSWWFPEEPAEEPFLRGLWISNPNILTSEECDPVCGSWTNRGLLCRVYKVPDYTRE